jgi:hypothetical protein
VTLGRRFELLTAHAARNIAAQRRTELLDSVQDWLESDDCPAESIEEMFYALAGVAAICMSEYCEEVQARIGGEILEREMKQG